MCFMGSAWGEPLTWEESVKRVSQNDPALQAAMESLEASKNQTFSSANNFLPQISGGVNYTDSNSTNFSSLGTISSTTTSYSTSLSVSQNLFNGLSDLAKYKQGKANEGVALSNLKQVKAQVSYNLKAAFEAVRFGQKAVSLAKEITSRRDQNLRLVDLRFKNGHENKGSVLLYQAYLMDSKYSELQTTDAVQTAKAQLAQELGMDDFNSLEVVGEIPVHDPSGAVDLKLLMKDTPTYLQAFYQEQASDQGITLARSGFSPTLSVSGLIGKLGPSWFPENDRWSVGLSLNIPIFNGGRDFFATRSAIDTHRASEFTLHYTALQALSQLQQAKMAFVEAVEKLKVDTSYLQAAVVRAEIARADYKNGLMTFQDWDLAETDLINRQRSILQSEQARVIAEAAWEQAQGIGAIP